MFKGHCLPLSEVPRSWFLRLVTEVSVLSEVLEKLRS